MTRAFLLPIALRLEGRHCLAVGDGPALTSRVEALLEARAVVHALSLAPDSRLKELAATGAMTLEQREFRESDLDSVWLAVLTSGDVELARAMAEAAERRRVWFCAVDQPRYGSFSHLALARAGALCIAVSTRGRAPALAARLGAELERLLRESAFADVVERLAELRTKTPSAERARVLGEAASRVRFTGRITRGDE